jgi:hypothetical protein
MSILSWRRGSKGAKVGPMSYPEWAELAKSLGQRKFVARFEGGFFLLSTDDTLELQTVLQTQSLAGPKAKGGLARRSFDVLAVAKSAENDDDTPITVGRTRTCDVAFKHPSVSKVHAHLVVHGKKLEVIDLGSRNGTLLNGNALEADKPSTVAVRDRIQFGSVQTMVLDAHELYDLLSMMP